MIHYDPELVVECSERTGVDIHHLTRLLKNPSTVQKALVSYGSLYREKQLENNNDN